ncbi:hypothetical protein CMV_010549 [Castanea mollissima]|uniref:Uncharacterized protein n=1 Tax=Castanea mollissima TaxID=60419 RepID=A0A8J4VPJ8_9ROSI|nr:hypothetical protein CMV_010549 [Castanea mollissima]
MAPTPTNEAPQTAAMDTNAAISNLPPIEGAVAENMTNKVKRALVRIATNVIDLQESMEEVESYEGLESEFASQSTITEEEED